MLDAKFLAVKVLFFSKILQTLTIIFLSKTFNFKIETNLIETNQN